MFDVQKKVLGLWWLITLTEHLLRLPAIALGKKVEMSEEKKPPCLRDSIAFIMTLFSTSSRIGCSSPSVVRSLGSGVFMLLFRLLEEFLPWCLPISSFRCSPMALPSTGLLLQDQCPLLDTNLPACNPTLLQAGS